MVDMDLSPYNAALVGLRKYYTRQGKDRLTKLVQEYDARKNKCPLQNSQYNKSKIHDKIKCCPKYQAST